VQTLFAKDAELSRYYHQQVADGKWNHMMDQTHIGYDNWQQPDQNNMPEVHEIDVPAAAAMGVAVEGSENSWPNDAGEPASVTLTPYQQTSRYLEVFNRGQAPFEYTIEISEPWLHVEPARGTVDDETLLEVQVEWFQVPSHVKRVPVTVVGSEGSRVEVFVTADMAQLADGGRHTGFVEADGYISMEAENFTRAVDRAPVKWQKIPDLGRTLSAVTMTPVTAPAQSPENDSPRLEYDVYLSKPGEVEVQAYLSPTLNFHNSDGLRYAVSFDDQPAQTVNMHADKSHPAWQRAVSDNINISSSKHRVEKAGPHVVKFWAVDPGVVLQKLVVTTGKIPASYLGPPESIYVPSSN
jgi:hypothetical protein